MKKETSQSSNNGKGDSPRNCFSKKYKENYDAIFRKNKKNDK
jgi:hypothetical protein